MECRAVAPLALGARSTDCSGPALILMLIFSPGLAICFSTAQVLEQSIGRASTINLVNLCVALPVHSSQIKLAASTFIRASNAAAKVTGLPVPGRL